MLSRRFIVALAGLALALESVSACASGREGEALVTPILWIVGFVVLSFAALVLGGGALGAFRASRRGESIPKGAAHGLRTGVVRFLVVQGVALALVTLLGVLWIAFALLYAGAIKPS